MITDHDYRIAGKFHMVQNFAVFADRLAAMKIRTANFSSASYGLLGCMLLHAHIIATKWLSSINLATKCAE